MVLPNAFIVGVPKSGTTAVFAALSRQPNVCPSTTKETGFFNPLKYGEKLPALADYEKLFEPRPGDTTVFEATPGYFTGGEAIAERIQEVSPQCRVAIILREPGARAFSWYRFQRTRVRVPQEMSFDEYLDRCETLGTSPEYTRGMGPWTGLAGGLYSRWLPEWQRVFEDRLLVMYSDDFRADPAAALTRIGAHLGIDVTDTDVREQNVSVDIKGSKLQKIALRLNNAGELLWRRFPRAKQKLMTFYYRVNARGEQERMTDTQRKRLDAYYQESLDELRTQLPDVPEKWGRP